MKNVSFNPFPRLEIDGYVLRKIKESDIDEIFITRSDERILKYLDIPQAKHKNDALKFIQMINTGIEENKWIFWGIVEIGKSKIVGTICLWNLSENPRKADIGFVLLPEYQGKGIMQKVVPKVIEFGFNQMDLEKIEGEVAPENIKSISIMKRFGFIYASKLENTEIYSLSRL